MKKEGGNLMKKWSAVLTALMIPMLLFVSCAAAQELRVDFYDMGKADAMLITTPSGQRILIDTGTNKGGKALVERFEAEGIDVIDVMIITHYDKDHVGGADKVLEDIGVRQVYMPVYDKESKQHTQFMEALEVSDAVQHPLEIGSQTAFDTGDGVALHITAAHRHSYGHDEENDFSLAVRLTYGETKFFFAGDAEAPRQMELLEEGNVACDVLKVPYHGRLVKASEAFIREASPKIAFIPDGDDDPASPVVIGLLEETGAKVYCGRDGSIAVVSDGRDVKVL